MSPLEAKSTIFIFALCFNACGGEPPLTPRSNSADAEAQAEAEAGDDTADHQISADDDQGYEDNPADIISDIGEDPIKPMTLAEKLAECGGINFDQPDVIIADQSMTGLTSTIEGNLLGLAYRITIDPTLRMESSLMKSSMSTDFAIATDQALAQDIGEEEVASRKGTRTIDYLSADNKAGEFGKDSVWDGIVCTVNPAYRVWSQVGGQNVVTEFTPPLPASIFAKADPDRYADEWKDGARHWQGIKATVKESTNDIVPTGTVITGTVSIRPIASTGSVLDDNNVSHTVQGDLAYEISMDFGGVAKTKALGLFPVTRMYIKHTSRAFSAVQFDSADDATDDATFLSN